MILKLRHRGSEIENNRLLRKEAADSGNIPIEINTTVPPILPNASRNYLRGFSSEELSKQETEMDHLF